MKWLCIFCQGNLCFGDCQFAVIGSVHWFTGEFLASNGYILRVGMSFHRFAHK